jgi:phosphohistidine phosphatase
MDLYILRHAIAEPLTPRIARDSERSLTPEGETKMWRIAKGMKMLDLSFDLILSSPFRRSLQTAEIVAEVFKVKEILEILPALASGTDTKELVEALQKRVVNERDVLLVGHEPDLSRLIALLLSGDPTLQITMKKGGLCRLKLEALNYGRCGVLDWLLAPSQLVRVN